MKRIAVFPGSFDPITTGHEDIVLRGAAMFDEVVVAIGVNTTKNYLFSLEQRLAFVEKTFAGHANIRVTTYEGLTVEFCKSIGAKYLLRGLRNSTDFEYESTIANMNKAISDGIETILLVTAPELCHVQSTVLREIYKNNGDISSFLPKGIQL
ncbi:MAG: pantetheine-phosphate adenylyltransferase [Flavobacteriales bacterium]|jgi:pantetheine-phosphate adenylyltransferase|nr:pantetheine-phosphate adenylyltransferase [Flavobacteriales bacterium]MDP4717392.1 pantetheine-phosphate adenylyltransferase [Flavobacteriales bacterium]MDP4731393.1 pantetheine-phosphate adenylyltransferase [Flavobacteriales bacterium]MDP4818179.1 pantetheine-phosphate adenylyltransferase [Flavobacteriales bacterium]MDP4951383.1 pantetheine-phosphate adenylyltransferase [Flavobacteriales bacterium]